ncbi:MAG: phage tail sheath subtilisin-like domain-containing protein [Thiomicrorhabdus sp.]|jgi:hypothetical protein|nr:phage tail sheath subtilisin-like domain-containing protein [Thiomicrorhabdus sp.]
MSFNNSAGVYDRIVDKSFSVSESGLVGGGVVITSKKGPTSIRVVTSSKEFIEVYGIPSKDNPSMYAALRFLNRAGILAVRRVTNDAVTASGTLITTVSTSDHLIVSASNPGVWGNAVEVTFSQTNTQDTTIFNVFVAVDGVITETYECSRDESAKNGYGSNIYIEDVINNNSQYISVVDVITEAEVYDYNATITLTGGLADTIAPTSGDIVSAWDEFANVEEVPSVILINAGWAVPEVQVKMLAVAESRKDAVAILDVPQDADTVAEMVTYRTDTLGANTYFGAIYGGWVKVYDQYNDREVTIPPSGDVAAIYVHTRNVAEVWDAPAGLQRGIIPNALGVTRILTEGERDQLYVAGINPVTTYAGASAIVWGQKSLQVQASAMDRMNVVNSVLWINGRMVKALFPFVFQPNTVSTRNNINFLLSSFLDNVKLRGGLYDFYIDTSATLNTAYVIDANQLLVDVYIKPVRSAEFIRVSTIVTPTGVTLA